MSLELEKDIFNCYLVHTRRLQSIFAVQWGLRPHLLNAAPFTEFDVFMTTTRLVHIEDVESVHGTLWQNSHGGNELLGTAKVSTCCTTTGSQNSRWGAAARLVDGASGGQRGAGRRLSGQWLGTTLSVSKPKWQKVRQVRQQVQQVQWSCTSQLDSKRGLGMCRFTVCLHPSSHHRCPRTGQ